MNRDFVIGGGLLGMLTARELALAGRSVVLLDRNDVGRESSWAGGGILSPLHPWRYPDAVTQLARWSQQHYEKLARELAQNTGIDPQWTRSGLLWLSTGEKAEALAWAAQEGYDLTLLQGERAVRECEPAVAPGFDEALFLGSVAQVRNPRLLQAARAELLRLGVEIRESVEVQGFVSRDGRLKALVTAQGELAAEQAVVAAGAWSGRLLADTGLKLPVKPVRGQMLLFKAEPGLLTRMVMHQDRYVIPRRDGRILAGSTVEDTGFEKQTTPEALSELKAAACAMVPALERFPIEHHWAGLRPGSPTGIPYVGEHPHFGGLYVNAGHFRNGVVLGLASTRLLADLMLGRSPILDPGPYAPVPNT
ncbi:MAG: glycine oxidase ThiO [Thiohalomonadaceae bacterium]